MSPTEIVALNFACALIGFFLGNRFAIGRDKRIEFNALIDSIRDDLLGIRNNPNVKLRGAWAITFIKISEKLPRWKRKGFNRAIENYKKSRDENNRQSDKMGGFTYKDSSLISHAADGLLKYVKPR